MTLKEQLKVYGLKDVASVVNNLETAFRTEIWRFFPGHGEQIINQEDGLPGPSAWGNGDKAWVACYNRLWNLLTSCGTLPYASYAMEVTMAEWLLCINENTDLVQKDNDIPFLHDFDCGYDEISERMMTAVKLITRFRCPSTRENAFLWAPYHLFRAACDEMVAHYPSRTKPDMREQRGYLHRHVHCLPYLTKHVEDEVENIREEISGLVAGKRWTLRDVLVRVQEISETQWNPHMSVTSFLDRQHALWLWLYDDVMMPLMQAAAAYYYHKNKADYHSA